jgi:hypothetical protein
MGNPIRTAGGITARRDDRRPVQIIILPGDANIIVETHQHPRIFGAGDLPDFHNRFVDKLNALRLDVQKQGVKLAPEVCQQHLQQLLIAGRAAYNALLPDAAKERIKSLEALEPGRWLSLTFFTQPEFSFWWEMLYSGLNDPLEPESFWGFRYPIGRRFWNVDIPDRILMRAGVLSAIHDQLRLSRDEVNQIVHWVSKAEKQLGLELKIKTIDDYPDKLQSLSQLVRWFESQEFGFGVVHFACHCDNPADTGALDSSLRLKVQQQGLELSLLELLRLREKNGFHSQPLVFLNACESGTGGHLLQGISFPKEMLNFHAGGVIATACSIPENFASAFAVEFYRRLLDIELNPPTDSHAFLADIGKALQETRLFFLREYNNPLGLAYGLFAISNQEFQLGT